MSQNDSDSGPGGTFIDAGTRRVRGLGRVTIPKEIRDRHGLSIGDDVDVRLTYAGRTIECAECSIISHGQVTIPREIRRDYDIDHGDYVELYVSRSRPGSANANSNSNSNSNSNDV